MTSRGAKDRSKWEELYASGARPDRPPSAWVARTLATLPNDTPVADVAGGTGRHATLVARPGRVVVIADVALQAVTAARRSNPAILGVVAEVARLPLRAASFGIVLVTNFLDRSVFPELVSLLMPGGFLVYETYTLDHLDLVERGLARGPHSHEYLLHPGELRELARPLTILEYGEADVEDEAGRRRCASLLARSK